MRFSIVVVFSCLLLSACASFGPYDWPEAYLVVDGKSYEMVSGTSCWDTEGGGSFCSDSFAHLTQIKPIKISPDSKVELRFKTGSTLKSVYLQQLDTMYYRLNPMVDEDDPVGANEFNTLFLTWESDPKYDSMIEEYEDSGRVDLPLKIRQEIKVGIDKGLYIYSVGSWWANGDIFFDILVEHLAG